MAQRGERTGKDQLAALAVAARDGDVGAFEQLVIATSPQVHALVLRLVRNEHDAGDVVQETYLRAFRSIGMFRSEASVTTWLYRIAANCSSSHLRRRRAHDVLAWDLPVADLRAERAEEAAASGADDRDRLIAALDGLSDPLRSVVVLHDVYDLPHETIAAELGISKAASKVRLHRARRRLRDTLFFEPGPGARPRKDRAGEVAAIAEPIGRSNRGTSGRQGRPGRPGSTEQGGYHAV